VADDGGFELQGLVGPMRLMLQNPPSGWRIESADLGGLNAVDEPVTFGLGDSPRGDIKVVVAKGGAEISGRVSSSGAAVGATSIDPGVDAWKHPDVLARITPDARRVSLADGGRVSLDVRAIL
jgi:hypothetical protein